MFTHVSQEEFLARYWQQQSLVFNGDFSDAINIIDGDELAGLACEDTVESRIICGSGLEGPWTCQQGPFVEFDYTGLGRNDWTLLVQGVEQWDNSIRELRNRFDFLPRWRLEDVMASFAPVGGGVGPHFDYYDVFLIQVSGRRRWQLGQICNENTECQDNPQVKLLLDFDSEQSCELGPGDAIYIPAGRAHWGTSLSDDCVTLSIGFRAPSDKELITEAMELLSPMLSDARRYKDIPAAIDADAFRINPAAAGYAQNVFNRVDERLVKAALTEAMGRLVTDTRYCSYSEDPKVWTGEGLIKLFDANNTLAITHQPHCRMAYSDTQLFVNGEAWNAAEGFAKNLCHGRIEGPLDSSQMDIVIALLKDDMIELV